MREQEEKLKALYDSWFSEVKSVVSQGADHPGGAILANLPFIGCNQTLQHLSENRVPLHVWQIHKGSFFLGYDPNIYLLNVTGCSPMVYLPRYPVKRFLLAYKIFGKA